MPVRYLSDPELARLSGWPNEIAVEDTVIFFTLSADDLSWLAGCDRQQNRLGVAIQLSTLPCLGWIPDDLAGCPPIALDRVAQALGIAPDSSSALLAEYGGWQGRTRREHRARVLARLGWRLCAAGERKLLDELVQLLDQALAGADSRARQELSQRLVDRAKAELDRGRLLDEILDVLADPNIPDEQAGRVVRQRVGMDRLIAARRPPEDRGQRDHGHFDLLAARYKYLRTFTPVVIAALPLTGNTASPSVTALLTAVEVLRELNAAARTAVPDEATTAAATVFVPARWRGYLDAARGQGRGAAYRHYWELGVLYGVQAGLRSGDVWVPGSRRYTDPSTLLLPPDRWSGQRDDFCTITGTDPCVSRQLDRLEHELHAAVAALETVLADPSTAGLARLGDDGE